MRRNLGKLALLIVAIIWGSGFAASALALENFSTYQVLALRFSLAFVVCLIVYCKDLKNMRRVDIKKGMIIGVFLFCAFLLQTLGLERTTASKNAFLTAINIIIVPFLSRIILNEKIRTQTLLGTVMAFIGIALLSIDVRHLQNLFNFNLGDVLTLICAIFFALQIFYTDYYVRDVSTSTIMVFQMGVAALLSWITVFSTHQNNIVLTNENIWPIVYLGLVSTMIAYGLQTWAQRYTSSSETAVILSTEAFFGMLASIIILQESVTISMMIGAIFIFVGIICVELRT
ncbi:DMT family transporter [Aerococcaceae bacterium zg-BR9]|uniref:DMT family transporter n=1 Tax=Aerococcaceae bacterium zg-1292 TaxID=2774330 RepID=UPI0040639B63|nr:DMT family transporter [Aerococcaceae bacterium zg-BR9]